MTVENQLKGKLVRFYLRRCFFLSCYVMLVILQYVVLLPFVFVFFSSRTGEKMCAYSRNYKKGDDEDDDDGDAGANNDN